jgi:predicted nuclease of predicted toxin-antitoxin system
MKLLLDENLPHRPRLEFPNHEVMTVAYMGWAGVKNGELLNLAETNGFAVLLTGDRNIAHQQNLKNRSIALVSLTALDWEIIRPHLAEIAVAVDNALPGSFQLVECGEFRRH